MHSFFLKSYFGLLYVSGVTGVVNIGGQESSAMKPRMFFNEKYIHVEVSSFFWILSLYYIK